MQDMGDPLAQCDWSMFLPRKEELGMVGSFSAALLTERIKDPTSSQKLVFTDLAASLAKAALRSSHRAASAATRIEAADRPSLRRPKRPPIEDGCRVGHGCQTWLLKGSSGIC